MILEKITGELYWIVLAILFLNLMQRKHTATGHAKRTATLMLASLVLLLNLFFALIMQFQLPQWLAIPSLLITILVGYLLRRKIAIFTLKCTSCGTKLSFNQISYFDDNLCDTCRKELHPELFPEEEEAEPTLEELNKQYKLAKDVDQIDWDLWEPEEKAVICYVFKDDKVMLIRKKTGLGKGLINAPGGRIEEAETALEAAVRETEEETGLTPKNIREAGTLSFQFTDGYSLKGYVFFADDAEGTMGETEEADPFWIPVDEIPYDKMWEDDALWLPKAIAGSYIDGRFIFDDRTMLSSHLIERERS